MPGDGLSKHMSPSFSQLRYIHDPGRLSSAEGLAGDEALAISVARREAPPTLHLYEYKPAVIVGRYQNLADAVDLDKCARRGHEWNRRHTGGGTVLMGPGTLAIGLALPEEGCSPVATIREHFLFFSTIFIDALSGFGIEAELVGKNDLAIDGRKVAGLAISQDIEGCGFLHCSLLLDFDIALMVDLLNLSTRDLDDRGQSCFAQRMTTVCEHNLDITFAQMQQAVLRAVEKALGVRAAKAGWTPAERALIDEFRKTRYENDDWIYSSRVMRRWTGVAEKKTPGGNLRIYVDRNDSVLDAVLITGDYFSRDIEIARLESSLRFVPVEPARLRQAIATHDCNMIYRVSPDELVRLILDAASPGRMDGRRVLAG
jgi:lipoate-protein ligase A